MVATAGRVTQPAPEVTGVPVLEERDCGCVVASATRSRGSRVLERCVEGERLWGELRSRRDEMEAGEGRGERKGHKARIDAFAAARAEHARHVGIGA